MKTFATLTLLAAFVTPAAAQQGGGLFWLTGEIRGQIAAVEAQATVTLAGCDDADDVYDELRDLCRELDRFEAELRQPIVTRGQLRRLARRARDVDEQACDLQGEIVEAIEELRDDRRHFGRRNGPSRFGVVPAVHPVDYVANRVGTHFVAGHRVGTHRGSQLRGYTDIVRASRRRGVSVAVGGRFGPFVQVGVGPAVGFHRVGHPVVPPIAAPLPGPAFGPGFGQGGFGPLGGECQALLEQADRLRGLTRQLRRIVVR